MEKRFFSAFWFQLHISPSIHVFIHYKYLLVPQAAQACRGEGDADACTVLGAQRCRIFSGSSLPLAVILMLAADHLGRFICLCSGSVSQVCDLCDAWFSTLLTLS